MVDLKINKDLVQVFVMKFVVLESKLVSVGIEFVEDKVVIVFGQIDGIFVYIFIVNNGFWCEVNGNVGNWGDMVLVYVEFSGLIMIYGYWKGVSVVGQKYMLKFILIYIRNGVQYKVIIVLNM